MWGNVLNELKNFAAFRLRHCGGSAVTQHLVSMKIYASITSKCDFLVYGFFRSSHFNTPIMAIDKTR